MPASPPPLHPPPDSSISPEVSGLLSQLSELSNGLKHGQPGAREGLMAACGALVSELAHPMESFLNILWAQPAHHAILRLGVDLHLYETLAKDKGKPKTIQELAAPCSAEPLLVSRMMKHLAAMGTVREVDVDTYGPTPLTDSLAGPHLRDSVLFLADDFLPEYIKAPSYFAQNGYKNPTDPADSVFSYTYDCKGENFWEYCQRTPETGRRFGNMMTAWSVGRPRWMDDGYYPVQERLIEGSKDDDGEAVFLVDVGGGRGHDLEGLKQAHPNIKGRLILQDRPEVVALAELSKGLEKMGHDFTTPQPVKGARAYLLHSIMQNWDDSTCTTILRQLIPALTPHYSRVLLNEFLLPNRGAHWSLTGLDWALMHNLSARQRTLAEFEGLLEAAGLKITGIYRHPGAGDSVIEAELA